MYILFFLLNFLGLYSMNYVVSTNKRDYITLKYDYITLKNKYNNLQSDFLDYKVTLETGDKSYKNRLVNLRLEYAQLKVNYKQLLNENLSLREENLDLKEDLKNLNDNNSPVLV